ncbi:potassium channel family protein [Marivita hallyeonensis]|uniref:Ion channel n=1 Tax=Marivita hallyeonensis TaxID=996342 RepID=A0A1M5TXD9_9RHOB|nr:potassium channel family protein [Marivita hallyeonensis]SHH55286.1 Ion channel [Marivita hallyeonensis]
MNLITQVSLGTGMFLVASFLQLAWLLRLSRLFPAGQPLAASSIARLLAAIASIHLAQIALWACVLWMLVADLSAFQDAFYFTLVTYTTVGYGDLTLDDGSRIFGAMAAFAGILGFGMSTAFLVNIFARTSTS